ncbi:MAG TPA: sigma-70 family RNA polymerase sigma factor [Solirubrobacterales bacterium]|nr:sigma-70 family RNA polymerase sigma factor [Solirubrobacterales bacterium]
MPHPGDRPAAVADLERERFEECFRAHYADVLAFAVRRLGDRGTAEDATSDTFAVAWRRRERIPDPALPWLYAVALRVISNQYRSSERRRKLDRRLTHEAVPAPQASDPVDSLDRRDSFAIAFGQLTEPEREVLRLVAWDGLSTVDAARVFGCSPGAFRVRLHRARRKLAKHLRAAGHLAVEPSITPSKPAEEAN